MRRLLLGVVVPYSITLFHHPRATGHRAGRFGPPPEFRSSGGTPPEKSGFGLRSTPE